MVASFAQNVRLAVKTLEDVAVGTFALFMMMIQQSPLIGMLFLISSAWILVRYAVIAIIPTLMYMSTAFDIYLNMIIAVIDAVILAIKGVDVAVIDIERLVGASTSPQMTQTPIGFVSTSTLRSELSKIPPTCRRYSTPSEVFVAILRAFLSKTVCPAHRYVWPDVGLYDASYVLTAFYVGSSVPDPNNPSENCNVIDTLEVADFICIGLGLGYIIGVLWILLLVIFIISAYRSLLGDAITATYRGFVVGLLVVETAIAGVMDVVFF